MANRYPLIVDSSSQQIKELPSGDTLVIDNLQVTGTTTSIETATLNVEDKNITINYSTGDSSSTADGSGLTFQDAVDASTDATILWDASLDKFDLSHGLHIGSANVIGDATTPALQIGGTTTYRLGMYTTTEGGVIENKNGDDGLQFRVKTVGEAMRIDGGGGRVSIDKSAYIKQVALTSSSNSVAWDAQAAANAYHLLTENTTFAAPSNAVEGAIISVEIAQGGTPYTVAWNTVFEFAASTAPTMTATANKTDIFSFRYNGSVWQEIGRVQNMAQT